jgi:hypothetical protein
MSALGRWTSREPLLNGDPRPLLNDQRRVLLAVSPYNYSLNNPANLRDPDGRCPVCLVAWAAVEVGLTAYDAYNAYQTYNDPNATPGEKSNALRMATLGAVGPGGGYTTLAKKYDDLAAGARPWYQKAHYLGKAGETRVQAAYGFTKEQSQKTIKLESFTSKSGARRVDFMSAEHGMVEVKNVSGTLSYTKQLRDFADYAADKGTDLTVVIPKGTKINGELQGAVARKELTIKTFEEIKNIN